jgi:selenocysteine lyase/cysteine desulfurase
MEEYFKQFRDKIIGINHSIETPFGNQPIVYTDWTASGRNYLPIEQKMVNDIMPFVANTHTETNSTGMAMTHAYAASKKIIKQHVNASSDDAIICANSGMTGVANKFQRILGLKIHERYKNAIEISEENKPVVFVTHMEHHSNQTTWLETIADVVVVPPNEEGLVCLIKFKAAIDKYKDRKYKIAAITSCSNVTGIITPYHEVAKLIHEVDGFCFVDFACSAPYIDIDMHPQEKGAHLDAIYFSPHKFLGGPGTAGVLIFNKILYQNHVPDNPGGGTVEYTNPWGDHKYIEDIETREDGGTPAFLQTIKTALCINLKQEMGVENMMKREHELINRVWTGLTEIPNLTILAANQQNRLGVISFYIDNLHYNVGVKMLNDRFGIQTRGGCSCAGTYGHYLLNIDEDYSQDMADRILHGDCSTRPGWIRMSIHPTTTDAEVDHCITAIQQLADNFQDWISDYEIDYANGSVRHKSELDNDGIKSKMNAILGVTSEKAVVTELAE